MSAGAAPLSSREVGRTFRPLAFSWLLMAVESPICTRIAFWLPNGEVNSAAVLAMFSLALLIESPVIDLLSTATTLARDKPSYAAIRGFAVAMIALVGGMHALVAFTPLYDVAAYRLAGLHPDVAEAARVPFMTMVPWSPLIGWRRFQQGILIRHGASRAVGVGTVARLLSLLAVGGALVLGGQVSGAQAAATALVASVGAECLVVTLLARRTVAGLAPAGDAPSFARLVRFHLPLTGATLVQLSMFAAVVPSLSRLQDPVLSLASWQVLISVAFLSQTVTYALPEVVIAFSGRPRAREVLTGFCLRVGLVLSGLVLALVASGWHFWLFAEVLDATPRVAAAAAGALLWTALLPLIRAYGNLYRGLLTAAGITSARLAAIAVGAAVLVACLTTGVLLRWPGLQTAVAAVLASAVAEALVLVGFWRARGGVAMQRIEASA